IDAGSARVADLLHLALTRTDDRGGRAPDLATAWTWLDDRTLRLTLRPDARFADGRPVRAEDVRAPYEAIRDPVIASPRGRRLGRPERADAPADRTVVMPLAMPDAAFLDATGLPVLPAEAAGARWTLPLGAGPFRILETTPDRIVLAPNPYWYG